ncbi:MAG: GspH/FimT family pseudopilin [Aquabacterium sp.]|nr:GspH/FimT family pseudopilin [Aquabacterium sp.]
MPHTHHQRRTCNRLGRWRGLSMVELLCVLAIMALLLGGALPLLNDLRLGQRLQATAALLETDIHFARSSAISTNQPVRLVVQALQAGGSCYLLHTGTTGGCACTGQGEARCDAGSQLLRLEILPAAAGVTLVSLAHPLVFDGRKATVTPTATLRLQSLDGRAIHQVVHIMGRVRSCSPAGRVGGLRPCQ